MLNTVFIFWHYRSVDCLFDLGFLGRSTADEDEKSNQEFILGRYLESEKYEQVELDLTKLRIYAY